jgi:hypothetical protein
MDLNHRPVDYRSTALPLSYYGKLKSGVGFGPTPDLKNRLILSGEKKDKLNRLLSCSRS